MSLYDILGVTVLATPKEIKMAYNALVRKYHPDLNPNDPVAVERFREATEAYEVLSDAAKRRKYDKGFEPVDSVEDLFTRHPAGVRTVGTMLPSAPSAQQPGVDLVVTIAVPSSVLRKGGRVEVAIKTKEGVRDVLVNVPEGADRTPSWCRVPGLGSSGRNGGKPGDLLVYLVPAKKGKKK